MKTSTKFCLALPLLAVTMVISYNATKPKPALPVRGIVKPR